MRRNILCLFAVLFAPLFGAGAAAANDLPKTDSTVPAWGMMALLSDETTLEGVAWVEQDIGVFCLSGSSMSCVGALDLKDGELGEEIDFVCDGEVKGSARLDTKPAPVFGRAPLRAIGLLSDGREMMVLFGTFRLSQGAACFDHSASVLPKREG